MVKFGDDEITENILLDLTRKEVNYTKRSDGYVRFGEELFDIGDLEYVLFHSKFLFNDIDVYDILGSILNLNIKLI